MNEDSTKIRKVIHISRDDMFGAGKAACRISDAINQEGVVSEVYVINGYSKESCKISGKSWNGICRRLLTELNWKTVDSAKPNTLFHYDKFGVAVDIKKILIHADVINLHWVNDGIWSESFVQALIELKKPIVWTLHDMWPFTAGCHYDGFCANYRKKCQNCPAFLSKKGNRLVEAGYELKKKLYSNANITFVGCSSWMTDEAKTSSYCREFGKDCITINNPINVSIYRALDVTEARRRLGIETNKKVILFGAVNALSDSRKGFSYLMESIKLLNSEDYMLMIFGSKDKQNFYDFEVKYLGELRNEEIMHVVYSAADVFVAPSIQENLANTVLESLSCGTPVVAFDIGGMRDMIIPKFNGDLAKPYDSMSLTQAIRNVTTTEWDKQSICDNVAKKFSYKTIGEQYIELYRSVMGLNK